MDILSYGTIKPIKIKCDDCGATLQYLGKDVHVQDHKSYITCPVCDKEIQVAMVEQKIYDVIM